jgi:hypothetical protein
LCRLWCNWIFVALTAVGWLGIAHFWAPARADLGIDATKVWFSETHHWGTIIGCTLFYIAPEFSRPAPSRSASCWRRSKDAGRYGLSRRRCAASSSR